MLLLYLLTVELTVSIMIFVQKEIPIVCRKTKTKKEVLRTTYALVKPFVVLTHCNAHTTYFQGHVAVTY